MYRKGKYSQETIDMVLEMTVASVLALFGRRTDHVGYMYYSPFRDERTPSMRVSVHNGREVWADFGGQAPAGKNVDGGGILDLAMRLGGFSTKSEAMDYLVENYCPGAVISDTRQERPRVQKEYGNVVDRVLPSFKRVTLISYAVGDRKIPREILEKYCREIVYHAKSNPSTQYHAIAWPQNNGGYTLRSSRPSSDRNAKKSTKQGISLLNSDGVLTETPSSEKGVIFEGFMDFMSWLAWVGREVPGCDVCVLNSVNNVSKAASWCASHGKIAAFLDNDDKGRECLQTVRTLAGAGEVRDMSSAYSDCNDVNEKWIAVCTQREAKAKAKGIER